MGPSLDGRDDRHPDVGYVFQHLSAFIVNLAPDVRIGDVAERCPIDPIYEVPDGASGLRSCSRFPCYSTASSATLKLGDIVRRCTLRLYRARQSSIMDDHVNMTSAIQRLLDCLVDRNILRNVRIQNIQIPTFPARPAIATPRRWKHSGQSCRASWRIPYGHVEPPHFARNLCCCL